MTTIYKYDLKTTDYQVLELPIGAEILKFGSQYGLLKLWCKVDSEETNKYKRVFAIYGTGHPVSSNATRYIGTEIMLHGDLVWHLFEVTVPGK